MTTRRLRERVEAAPGRIWRTSRHNPAAVTALVGGLVAAALFAGGAWQRRWIADDGLIVLRTVRNLLAGNGPVFNIGERVEANTSTLWTYLLTFCTWLTGGQPETVVLWVALVLSAASLPLAVWGAYRLYGPGLATPGAVMLPLGAIVYLVLPPARDFATSGLEVSLCLFWSAALWCLMVEWGQRRLGARGVLLTAFVAGLSPLVRPELALVGGLALVLLLFGRASRWLRVGIVAVAAALPVLYQVFRMGYYGVLVPNTAIAKDASGAKWDQGLTYLTNLLDPYSLTGPLLGAVVVGAAAVVVGWRRGPADGTARHRAVEGDEDLDGRPGRAARLGAVVASAVQSRAGVAAFAVVSGLLQATYWVRQGGDFMHGRVLLPPLFLMLLPVMAVPLGLGDLWTAVRGVRNLPGARRAAAPRAVATGVVGVGWVLVVAWAAGVAGSAGMPNGTAIGRDGIVDERRFYIANLGVEHPTKAADYLDFPRMRAMMEAVADHPNGGLFVSFGPQDRWTVVTPAPGDATTTVFFLNLGMTSMNLPLEYRVIDPMGLAYPMASHTGRLEDGRIGHDKMIASAWPIAGYRYSNRGLPQTVSLKQLALVANAYRCQDTQDLLASYTAPMSLTRFQSNLRQSVALTRYRIEANPLYELQRCLLPIPPQLAPKPQNGGW